MSVVQLAKHAVRWFKCPKTKTNLRTCVRTCALRDTYQTCTRNISHERAACAPYKFIFLELRDILWRNSVGGDAPWHTLLQLICDLWYTYSTICLYQKLYLCCCFLLLCVCVSFLSFFLRGGGGGVVTAKIVATNCCCSFRCFVLICFYIQDLLWWKKICRRIQISGVV